MLSPMAERLTGWMQEEAVGRAYGDVYRVQPGEPDSIKAFLEGRGVSHGPALLMSRSGKEVLVNSDIVPFLGESGEARGVICIFKPKEFDESQQTAFAQDALRDSLTGLYNRAFFEQELPRLDRPQYWPLSVLIGDLNGLKLTNDIFGHSKGDELLIAVSQAFLDVCRPQDRVFRWGGDEFIVLLPSMGTEEVALVRERLQRALAGRVIGSIPVNLPLGCSTKDNASQDIETVCQQAEEEMYWMKTIGQTHFERDTLNTLIKEFHDRSSGEREHAERVSSLSEQLGRHLGLASDELRSLRLCGLLHDIGKIALEPELLQQPYPLQPEQAREMKRHPLVGFRLLNGLEETADLAVSVLAHHEHWDGGGYPRGLKGEEIPYFGRILAITETYDRVHKRSHERALELIREGAGREFDPALSAAFLEMMQESA